VINSLHGWEAYLLLFFSSLFLLSFFIYFLFIYIWWTYESPQNPLCTTHDFKENSVTTNKITLRLQSSGMWLCLPVSQITYCLHLNTFRPSRVVIFRGLSRRLSRQSSTTPQYS
jgi:hypothetical protein